MKSITAEVITIGDEILFGQITDTNTQWISAELSAIGVRTIRKSSVGDQENAILSILAEAEQRADLIIITGGLGPTKDDITKHTLCTFFDTTLEINPDALKMVTDFFQKRGRELTDLNRQQAALPVGSVYLPNTYGTAPGMWLEHNGTYFVSLPGVPHEMKGLMTDEVLPRVKATFALPVIYHKMIHTIGIGESYLAERIEHWEDALPPHIRLAYLPSMGMVKLRLTATGTSELLLKEEVDEQIYRVLPLIDQYVFGYDGDTFEDVIAMLLSASGKTLATAESCTGGYLAHLLTKVSGSSGYYAGGVVSYSNDVKVQALGVKPETLDTYGAVSEETIREMAEGIRNRFGTGIGLATSGIAGPLGGTPEKPVGTVWIAIATQETTITRKLQLGGDRQQNIHLSAMNVLNLLRKLLLKMELV
ncbi:MAG: competence/damage-inducible protein A [Siphonobacter sp.]